MSTPYAGGLYITDAAGLPINGALINTYEAGTLSRKAVYTTSALDVAHPNPVVASNGRATLFLGTGSYRIRVTDADGVALPAYDADNIRSEDGAASVSAADYGAAGDGATDDTASLQAAINAIEAITLPGSGGGRPVLNLGDGVFLTGTLTINKRIKIRGNGTGSTFLKLKSGVTTSMFAVNADDVASTSIDDANHCIFEGMTLEGNRVDSVTTGSSHGIYCPATAWSAATQYSNGIRAEDVVIVNFTGDGIHLGENRNWSLVDRCIVRYCNDNALATYGYDGRFTDTDFGVCKNYGVREYAGGANIFTGCNLYLNTINYVSNSSSNGFSEWTGCSFDYAVQHGASISSATGPKKFVGCRFYGNSTGGAGVSSDLLITGASAVASIIGCSFLYAVQKVKYLVETASSPKVIFQGNDFSTQTADVPFATGICNVPSNLFGDVFEPQGLVPSSNSAAAANALIIQAAIDAANLGAGVSVGGGLVQLPAGTYFTTRLLMKPGVTLRGAGEASTRLKLANTANTDLLADSNYIANVLFASNPYSVQALTLDGNNANNTSGSCMVAQTYWSTFRDVTFELAAHNGCIVATKTANGTDSGNGVADTRFENCHFRGNKRSGVLCTNSTTNKMADVFFAGCTWNGNGESGYYQAVVERGSGFVFNECRFYSGYQGDIDITKFDRMTINGCNFELNVLSAPNTSTIFANIRVRSISGFGDCTITGNFFYLSATVATATDVYCALYFDVASTAGTVVAGNSFVAEAATTKRAIHGASSCAGIIWPNAFRGYSTGTEYGTAWANWTRATVGAAATDAATTQTLANNLRTALINAGLVNT
jgi:hypothetical protein